MALETVAAVAAIVSAFQGAAALYNSWKARTEAARRATGAAPVNDGVTQQSLQLGGRSVQAEYDRALSRVGAGFARGDDEGRTQLQQEIIALQQTVIGLLQSARDRRDGRLNINELISASEGRRVGAVRAIAAQCQRMAVAAPIPRLPSSDRNSRVDYFAFASNMHIEQMAKRCPTSLFRGAAVLPGYRWQINERGFANAVQSPADTVEGLVFSITQDDVDRLDRYEGVARGFYDRRSVPVQLAERVEGPWKTMFVARGLKKRRVPDRTTRQVAIEASVYISLVYVYDGRIRAEYAERMRSAVSDAVALGVSEQYVQQYITPRITASNRPRRRRRLSLAFRGLS